MEAKRKSLCPFVFLYFFVSPFGCFMSICSSIICPFLSIHLPFHSPVGSIVLACLFISFIQRFVHLLHLPVEFCPTLSRWPFVCLFSLLSDQSFVGGLLNCQVWQLICSCLFIFPLHLFICHCLYLLVCHFLFGHSFLPWVLEDFLVWNSMGFLHYNRSNFLHV